VTLVISQPQGTWEGLDQEESVAMRTKGEYALQELLGRERNYQTEHLITRKHGKDAWYIGDRFRRSKRSGNRVALIEVTGNTVDPVGWVDWDDIRNLPGYQMECGQGVKIPDHLIKDIKTFGGK
jgi:hypothetical protein